jgi:hypothetical protein
MVRTDKITALKESLAKDPFNTLAWEQLLGEISRSRKDEDQVTPLREVYEDLLAKFPTAVRN